MLNLLSESEMKLTKLNWCLENAKLTGDISSAAEMSPVSKIHCSVSHNNVLMKDFQDL